MDHTSDLPTKVECALLRPTNAPRVAASIPPIVGALYIATRRIEVHSRAIAGLQDWVEVYPDLTEDYWNRNQWDPFVAPGDHVLVTRYLPTGYDPSCPTEPHVSVLSVASRQSTTMRLDHFCASHRFHQAPEEGTP